MATENVTLRITAAAGADLSASQYRAVYLDANGEIQLAGVAATNIVGVLLDTPKQGEYGTIAVAGKTRLVSGGTIARGDRLDSDANAAAVAESTAGNPFFAIALDVAAAGDIFEALVAFGTV